MTRRSLDLPRIPRTQALSSKTFRAPPLDGSLTIPELYDWHYDNSPEHPLFIYSDVEGETSTITWSTVVRAVHRVGYLVRDLARDTGSNPDARQVFAIVATNSMCNFFTRI